MNVFRMVAAAVCFVAALSVSVVAGAVNIRVMAASEIRLEPRLRPDGRSLEVTVHARDDRQWPIQTRVRLLLARDGTREQEVANGKTNERGTALFVIPVPDGERAFNLIARTQDGDRMAGTQTMVRVDMDAPFVALDLDAPAQVDAEPDTTVTVTAAITRSDRSARGMQIALRLDERHIATASVDGSDRATFVLPVSQFRGPGLHSLRAEYARAGVMVSSMRRRLVLRFRTTLTLERAPSPENTLVLRGTLRTPEGPVPDAPVRLMDGSRIIASASTDPTGAFSAPLDPELLGSSGISIRAVFLPNEPWYRPSESPVVRVGQSGPEPVSWTRLALPALGVGLVLGLSRLRWKRDRTDVRVADEGPPRGEAITLERIRSPAETGGEVCIEVVVTDVSTGKLVVGAVCEWRSPGLGMKVAEQRVGFAPQGRVSFRVSAEGYAPRDVETTPGGAGLYTLRVNLSSMREAVFSNARGILRAKSFGGAVFATPREATTATADPTSADLLRLVEEGSYGPRQPDLAVLERAEKLSAALRSNVSSSP